MKPILNQLKEALPILVILGSILSVLFITYVQVFVGGIAMNKLKSDEAKLYLQQVISAELTAKGVAGGTALTVMSGDIENNTGHIAENKSDIVRVESKAERIAQILMED